MMAVRWLLRQSTPERLSFCWGTQWHVGMLAAGVVQVKLNPRRSPEYYR